MNKLKVIAITHKTFQVDEIGKFHLELPVQQLRLKELKEQMNFDEVMLLSTCNRVEFLISESKSIDAIFLKEFLSIVYPKHDKQLIEKSLPLISVYADEEALRHLFNVASSLDSLVVGEREIITQVRSAYDQCNEWGFTGDLLRIVLKKTIESAKEVYTQTNIAKNPVSVVSLAYRRLRELNVKLDARILIVGAGVTNTTMAKYLKKHGFKNFTVFNRTLANAQTLAKEINAEALPLTELTNYKKGFDVIVTCTGSTEYIITHDIYKILAGPDNSKKIVIDLAVPSDLDPAILNSYDVNLIAVNNLQEVAAGNLREREKEMTVCKTIIEKNIEEFKKLLKERKVELAMSDVPRKVKEIKDIALNEVFAKDIDKLDEQSKEVLDKVISYLEKKYISVPMIMAREIMLNSDTKK